MVQRRSWSVPVLAAFAVACALPLFAQRAGSTMFLFEQNQAEQIAQQIDQGQVNLGEAIKLAENEGKGKALQAAAKFHTGTGAGAMDRPTERPGQDKPGTPPGQATPGGQQLMFEVVVFANNQLSTYHVNPKTREIKPFGTRVDLTKDRP